MVQECGLRGTIAWHIYRYTNSLKLVVKHTISWLHKPTGVSTDVLKPLCGMLILFKWPYQTQNLNSRAVVGYTDIWSWQIIWWQKNYPSLLKFRNLSQSMQSTYLKMCSIFCTEWAELLNFEPFFKKIFQIHVYPTDHGTEIKVHGPQINLCFNVMMDSFSCIFVTKFYLEIERFTFLHITVINLFQMEPQLHLACSANFIWHELLLSIKPAL